LVRSREPARPQDGLSLFLHGLRLAGESGLLNAQVGGARNPTVRRNDIAGLEEDDISRDQVARGHLPDTTVPSDAHGRRSQTLERRHRSLGSVLLGVAENGVEDDDRQDDSGVENVAEEDRYCRRRDENEGQTPGQLLDEYPETGPTGALATSFGP